MNVEELNQTFNSILAQYGDRAVQAIRQRLIEAGKVKTGALLASIQYEVDNGTFNILALEYFDFLEYGTSRGIQPTDLLSELDPIFVEMNVELAQVQANLVQVSVRETLSQSLNGLSNITLI